MNQCRRERERIVQVVSPHGSDLIVGVPIVGFLIPGSEKGRGTEGASEEVRRQVSSDRPIDLKTHRPIK